MVATSGDSCSPGIESGMRGLTLVSIDPPKESRENHNYRNQNTAYIMPNSEVNMLISKEEKKTWEEAWAPFASRLSVEPSLGARPKGESQKSRASAFSAEAASTEALTQGASGARARGGGSLLTMRWVATSAKPCEK